MVDCLEASIWCLLNSDSYADCVLKAVNLGDDTDTTGAVAGGLAGLCYGYDNIPKEWIDVIASKEWIDGLCKDFATLVKHKEKNMSPKDERIEVFKDTMDWIEKDPDLSASIPEAKKNTTVFFENDYPDFDLSKAGFTKVTVSGDRSYQAAMKLHRANPDAKIAVMNFANAFQAGGGVKSGAGAQEECLCRTSTLYPLLYRRTLRDSFYKHHNDLGTPRATDSLIYTEGVIICKTDEDLPKRMPKEDWVTVDVITIAAPDLRRKSNIHVPLLKGGIRMNDAELFGYHVKRAIHMLTCAAAKGADILVLGAFGCGAFENDPEVVARAYKTALSEFPDVFKQIEFAVYCKPDETRNYDVFKRVLGEERKIINEDKWRTTGGSLKPVELDKIEWANKPFEV